MLDELLNLILPGWSQHVLLDALDCNHQPCNILDKDIIASYQQFLFGLLISVLRVTTLGYLVLVFLLNGGLIRFRFNGRWLSLLRAKLRCTLFTSVGSALNKGT